MEQTATQRLRPLLLHDNWELMEEYLAGEKSRLVTRLCSCNEDSLKDIQGQIKVIDSLLKMKQNLKTEMRSKS